MSERTIGRAAPLPEGFEYLPNGEVCCTYLSDDTTQNPIEQLIAKRPQQEGEGKEVALDDLFTAAYLYECARAELDKRAHAARQLGASYSQLARRVGITPQSAHQRWSEGGNKKHTEQRVSRQLQTNKTIDGADERT